MKKQIIITFISALLASGALYSSAPGGGGKNGDKYCAKMKDGRLVVMYEGQEVISETTLANGTIIQPDGTLIKKDGTRITLQEGQCVNKEGNVVPKDKKRKRDTY